MKMFLNPLCMAILVAQILFNVDTCLVHGQNESPDLVSQVLGKAEKVARTFPLREKIIGLCQVAAEHERLKGSNDLWAEVKKLIVSSDKGTRDKLWIHFGVLKAKVGDDESAKYAIQQITDVAEKDQGRRAICQAFADGGDLANAWDAANAIGKRKDKRYYAMECVMMAATKAGDFKLSARAGRSMDPRGTQSMKRKLLMTCFAAAGSCRDGEVEHASNLIRSVELFSEAINDPDVQVVFALTTAATERDDREFEKQLRACVEELSMDAGQTEKASLIAIFVDSLEVDRLALRLLEDYPSTAFAKILAERLASRFAKKGDRDSFDVVAPKLGNLALAKGKIQLASSLGKAGDSKTALEYLNSARIAIDSKKIPSSEIGPLRSLLNANLVKLGQGEALSEIESSVDKKYVFQTYLEILYLY